MESKCDACDMGRIVLFCFSFPPFFCPYPAFSSPLCRVQLYCADQEGAGTWKKVALIVTKRTKWLGWEHGGPWEGWKDLWRTACKWGVVLGEAGDSRAFSAFAVPFSIALNFAVD